MTLPARVTVTDAHIKAGIPQECGDCPIALALIEAIRALGIRDFEVSVYARTAVVAVRAAIWSANLPLPADVFISRFDSAMPVGPISFDLEWTEGNMS